MKTLGSFVEGKWVAGTGPVSVLVNPATEEPLAETSTGGVDFAAALGYARARGGEALRELTFAQRGKVIEAAAQALQNGRDELLQLAVENGGNTRGDSKFDVDGAIGTLMAYAEVGARLGDARALADGEAVQLGRSPRLYGQHLWTSRRGAAVHVNAFNFPAWGLAEKAAVAWLAGMPVVTKPATATAVVAHRIVELLIESRALPEGALSFVCGAPGDLLAHVEGEDVVAFTGSGETALRLRALPAVARGAVRLNVEADSLNAAVLGPDVEEGSETWQLFVDDVVRDMTQKTGQKCTAIRRVFVPGARVEAALEALRERLAAITVGNPADERVRMGPLSTRAQRDEVRAGIARLAAETEAAFGGEGMVAEPAGAPAGRGFFVGPVVRLARDARAAPAVHAHEVFGPVATVALYDGSAAQAAALVRLGGGALVASLYSDDREFLAALVPLVASAHGRLFLGSEKIAGKSPGPGTVLPQLVHGGPGRAGGGEELGGERGLRFYMQRTALEGDRAILAALAPAGPPA